MGGVGVMRWFEPTERQRTLVSVPRAPLARCVDRDGDGILFGAEILVDRLRSLGAEHLFSPFGSRWGSDKR